MGKRHLFFVRNLQKAGLTVRRCEIILERKMVRSGGQESVDPLKNAV